MKLYHGGEGIQKHSGLCLTDLQVAAAQYGGRGSEVTEIEVDLAGLNVLVLTVSDEDIENAEYPGDRAADRAAYLAQGVDVLDYNDATDRGYEHRTFRFLSDAALARI